LIRYFENCFVPEMFLGRQLICSLIADLSEIEASEVIKI
jgi:hypothetical protein